MREIKFRQAIFVDGKFDSWHYWGFSSEGFVAPADVCLREAEKYSYQYTGLKDKNGKEIYEGDIVKFNPDDDDWNDVVVWWAEQSCFDVKSFIGMWDEYKNDPCRICGTMCRLREWAFGSSNPVLIIGNIHDHPKLMESK